MRESLTMAEVIRRLVTREAAGELDAEDGRLLEEVEETYLDSTVPHCDAVHAPYVGDDPHWETRMLDEFAESDADLELEVYLELRRSEPDCERCPYASPYSLFPMDPCEFSAGLLEHILADGALQAQAARAMTPDEMRAYADGLEQALAAGRWRDIEIVDVADYLSKAAHFLRFWADHGFAILPTDIDEVLDVQASTSSSEESSGPATFH